MSPDSFCSRCGLLVPESVPFHGCAIMSNNPRSPFCEKCGKTLRTGFVAHVTCQCYEWCGFGYAEKAYCTRPKGHPEDGPFQGHSGYGPKPDYAELEARAEAAEKEYIRDCFADRDGEY